MYLRIQYEFQYDQLCAAHSWVHVLVIMSLYDIVSCITWLLGPARGDRIIHGSTGAILLPARTSLEALGNPFKMLWLYHSYHDSFKEFDSEWKYHIWIFENMTLHLLIPFDALLHQEYIKPTHKTRTKCENGTIIKCASRISIGLLVVVVKEKSSIWSF